MSVFGGDEANGVPADSEAREIWKSVGLVFEILSDSRNHSFSEFLMKEF